MILDERVNGLAENRGATNAGEMAREAERARDFGSGDFHAQRAVGLHVRKLAKGIGRAVGDELAVINIGDVAAALGFVHVVRGDEERDAVPGKLEEKIPELAARDGIDAGGGFVEEKKLRLVQHRAAKGEALLPATGKLRGQAIQIRFEAIELHNFVDASLEPRGLEAVDAAVELQVFRDGEIVVEAEVLRHVADAFAHGFGIGADIQAFNLGFLANPDAADFGLRDVDANVDLILLQKRGDRSVGSNQIARANVKNFDRSGGGSGDLALPETGFVVSIGCLREVDVFATVAALEFIELVLSTLLLRDRNFPVSFGRIALLL